MHLSHALAALFLLVPAAADAQQYPYAFQAAPMVAGTTAGTYAAGNDSRFTAPAITAGSINGTTTIATSGAASFTNPNFGIGSGAGAITFNASGGYLTLSNPSGVELLAVQQSAGGDYPFLNSQLGGVTFGSGGASANVTANYTAARGTGQHVFSAAVSAPSLQTGATSGPTIASGAAAPLTTTLTGVTGSTAGTPAAGSEYINTAGAAGARVYWYFGGAWLAQAAP